MEDRTEGLRSSLARGAMADPGQRRALRQRLIDARLGLPGAAREAAQQALARRLDALVQGLAAAGPRAPAAPGDAPILGVFVASRGEPDLAELYDRWRARGWRLALPRVVARDAPLEFGAWPRGAGLVPDRFDIPVPEPFVPVRPTLLVVPCVGFDARGWRLGYGGGFYDRTLAVLEVPAVGVAFDGARVDFEPAAHDRPLAAVVTPSAVWAAPGG